MQHNLTRPDYGCQVMLNIQVHESVSEFSQKKKKKFFQVGLSLQPNLQSTISNRVLMIGLNGTKWLCAAETTLQVNQKQIESLLAAS